MNATHNAERRELVKKSARLAGLAALSSTAMPILAGAQESQPSKYGIEGYEAPELDINYWIDGDGEPANFSIAESKGKWTLLKCFQSWCPGCHSSGFPTLKAFSDEFHGHPKVAIAGIQTVFEGFSTNTQDEVRKLQLRYKLPIVMGHDPGDPDGIHSSDTMLKYRNGGTPWIILIDPEGFVAFNGFRVDTKKLIAFVHEEIA